MHLYGCLCLVDAGGFFLLFELYPTGLNGFLVIFDELDRCIDLDGMAEVVANNCHSATERTGLGYGPVQGMMWALNELHTRIIDAERQADALEAAALQAATSGRADA